MTMTWQTITFNEETQAWDNLPPIGELCVAQLKNNVFTVGRCVDDDDLMFVVEAAGWRLEMALVKKWKLLEDEK
jgi:hypothetical protein